MYFFSGGLLINLKKWREDGLDDKKDKDSSGDSKDKKDDKSDKSDSKDKKEVPSLPSGELSTCTELLGKNLTAIVKASLTVLQIVGAIIAIIKGMMVLIPPILAKDADALKKAGNTLTKMSIILVIIFIFRPLLKFLGTILDFDVSCIV